MRAQTNGRHYLQTQMVKVEATSFLRTWMDCTRRMHKLPMAGLPPEQTLDFERRAQAASFVRGEAAGEDEYKERCFALAITKYISRTNHCKLVLNEIPFAG